MGMLTTLVGSRVPPRYRKYFNLPERRSSFKVRDTRKTPLGRAAANWLAQQHHRSGVYRLDLGLDALGFRVGLIRHAERSIDIQSYLLRDDLSGNLIAVRLIEAADRGVRVRLLMDDALTEPVNGGLISLNDHPNIDVRVFNPFPRRRSRVISFIANFNILNRRMHNKSFTVDNQVTIVGGRNLADEYYQTSGVSEFIDEDVAAIGAVVDQVSDAFDEYWNMPEAIPISVLDETIGRQPIEVTLEEGRRFLSAHDDSPYLKGVSDYLVRKLLDGSLPLIAADAEVVLDHPHKVRGMMRQQVGETTTYLMQMVSAAVREVVVVSPYFVPQMQGVEFFSALVRKGVRVVVVTNSLASTNHSSVHAVYARYRKPLLRQGVELYEFRPSDRLAARPDHAVGRAALTLHSKVVVVDRQRLFVGSFNLDPRSLYINTEMGIAVTSPKMANALATSVLDLLPMLTYSVRLDRRGRLQWNYRDHGQDRTVAKEPDTSIWRRLATKLMSLLPIEGQM